MRAALATVPAVGCYTPTPHERLACSETQHCPSTQSCDPVFHECASFPICKTPIISDRFDGSEPCASWGSTYGNAEVDVKSGTLVMKPAPRSSGGGCRTNDPFRFGPEGMFLEVSTAAATGATGLSLNSGAVNIGIDFDGKTLILSGTAPGGRAMPYDPAEMRWWRVRPVADGVLGEYSRDGLDWHTLGTIAIDLGQVQVVGFDLGVATDADTPAASELASLGVCPDGTQEP